MRILQANSLRLLRVAFIPDTDLLAASGGRGHVFLWNLTSRALQQSMKLLDWGVNVLCVAREGTALLAASQKVVHWDWANQTTMEIVKRQDAIDMLAISPSGKLLALASQSNAVGVMCCSFPDLRLLWQTPMAGNHFRRPIAFSHDGCEVITRRHMDIVFLRADTGQPSRQPLTFPNEVTHIAVSPDGKTLAFCAKRLLRVWQSDQPTVFREHKNEPKHFRASAFHPSGRLLATVSSDGKVRLFNVQTGQEMPGFEWSIGPLLDIAFSPNGMLAACCSERGKIVVWDVD